MDSVSRSSKRQRLVQYSSQTLIRACRKEALLHIAFVSDGLQNTRNMDMPSHKSLEGVIISRADGEFRTCELGHFPARCYRTVFGQDPRTLDETTRSKDCVPPCPLESYAGTATTDGRISDEWSRTIPDLPELQCKKITSIIESCAKSPGSSAEASSTHMLRGHPPARIQRDQAQITTYWRGC